MDPRRPGVIVLVAMALAAIFGAGIQYLGSFSMHPWMADVSLLSAPWLALPFLAGWTQPAAVRAALLGLACTATAWVGYGAMTLSPFEGAEMSWPAWLGFIRSQTNVILGGLVTGPLFGWFGYRWRANRAWLGALMIAAAFCLEPAAKDIYGLPIGSSAVIAAEIALGLAVAVYFAARVDAARRPPLTGS